MGPSVLRHNVCYALIINVLILALPVESYGKDKSEPRFLHFPKEITGLIINIGSNHDPPRPPDNTSIAVIAVEPVPSTAMRIPKHPRLYVITAAVSNFNGFAFLNVYNKRGMSSSLNEVDIVGDKMYRGKFSAHPDGGMKLLVPVLTLEKLLSSIPERIDVTFLKTDMQGHDYSAMISAGNQLSRVHRIMNEVWCNGQQSFAGIENDFHKHFQPFFGELKEFELENSPCASGQPMEDNAFWVNRRRGLQR